MSIPDQPVQPDFAAHLGAIQANGAALAAGAAAYRDVLDALVDAGLTGSFTQTGGSCAALEVRLDGGYTLLITGAEDCLPWTREDHRDWGVGLYPPHSEYDQGPLTFAEQADRSPAVLLALIREVLSSPPSTRHQSRGDAG